VLFRSIAGNLFLVKDFSLLCLDDDWWGYLPYAIAFVLIYPIGVPSFFLYMLARYRYRLTEVDIRFELGFLYEAFNRNAWYFELVDTINKLIMTSVIPFFPPLYQMPIGLACTAGYAIVILLVRPYRLKGDDRLHLLVQGVIFMMLTTGYVLISTNTNVLEARLDLLLSLMLIAMTCGLLLVFLVQAGKKIKTAVLKKWRTWRESWMHGAQNANKGKVEPKPDDEGKDLLPITNPFFQGASQGDLNALGRNTVNAPTPRVTLLNARVFDDEEGPPGTGTAGAGTANANANASSNQSPIDIPAPAPPEATPMAPPPP